jgi:hypothetical protein
MKRKKQIPMNPDARVTSWTVKLSPEEAQELDIKILHYAKGNRSKYLRTAVLAYKPKKEDFK